MQFPYIGRLYYGEGYVFEDGEQVLIGNEHFGVCVLYHKLEALRRVGRVQREVCTAGLECAQWGYHHVLVAAQHDADDAFWRHLRFYIGRQIVRQKVYFPVREAGVFVNQGKMVRAVLGVLAERIQNGVEGGLFHRFSVWYSQI